VIVHNNYLGIRAKQNKTDWVIKKIHVSGAANDSLLEVGDKIVLIDDKPVNENNIIRKWLIVEQAHSIVTARNGNEKRVVFSSSHFSIRVFFLFFIVSLIYLLFLFRLSRKYESIKTIKYFYTFSLLALFSLLGLVPSSVGDLMGRLIVTLFLSFFPIYVFLFFNKQKSIFPLDR